MADDAGAALREYQRKPRFSRTPEPPGEVAPERRGGDRVFVVQKHAASRLHYDFRLELEGVLKSWAVPKGPSLDPADKRLAMHVEDHPLEYGGFVGIIPKGEYGGGTVLLWDRGTWRPEGDPHRAYRAGNLKFTLDGEKLRGGWALVRIRDRRQARDDERSWLLVKHDDAEAQPGGRYSVVEQRPESVTTGRTLEEIATARDRVWHSNRSRDGEPAPVSATEVPGARPAGLPRFMAPQLATLVTQPPTGDAWLHEMKYDGYRILARLENGRVTLLSRNGQEWTEQFPTVVESACGLRARTAMLDGEVAVVTEDGRTSFQALQNYMSGGGPDGLVYMAFDLLHWEGQDLTGARLEDRKAALAALLGPRVRSRASCATAIMWSAPAPNSSPRRAGLGSKARCPSAATLHIAALAARTG
jgi:bifunctional non-homologous end joining protein LigD